MTGRHFGPSLWRRLVGRISTEADWWRRRWPDDVRPWYWFGERWEAARQRTWRTWRKR